MSEHIETKHRLKSICSITTWKALIDQCVLTDSEKQLLELHYLKGKSLDYIADIQGFSLSAIKKRHQKVLRKLAKTL